MSSDLPESDPGPRLRALVVTHGQGAFALACVRSLRREWSALAGRPDRLGVTVVEDGASGGEALWFEALAREGAQVLAEPHRLGPGAGLELAWRSERARAPLAEDEPLLLLRPDVVLQEGCLGVLVDHLEAHPEVGAIGPALALDPARRLRADPAELPGAGAEAADALARRLRCVARRRARARQRARHALWRVELPMAVPALDPAAVLIPSPVALALGPLGDPRYPGDLTWPDLFRRVAARGLTVVVHPRAHAVCAQRALPDPGADTRAALDRRAYRERWYGRGARGLLRLAEAAARREVRPLHPLTHLPPQDHQLDLALPGTGPWRVEVSCDPDWRRAWGAFASEARFVLAPEVFEWLPAGRLFVRALGPRGRVRAAWTLVKPSPARGEALEVRSAEHPEVYADWMSDLAGASRDRRPA